MCNTQRDCCRTNRERGHLSVKWVEFIQGRWWYFGRGNRNVCINQTLSLTDSKHVMLPTGELHVVSADVSDGRSSYRCRTLHKLTGRTQESATAGRIVIAGKPSGLAIATVLRCRFSENKLHWTKALFSRMHWPMYSRCPFFLLLRPQQYPQLRNRLER
jgi:hypothetical protein